MTRVHVTGVGYVLRIPDGWDRWTYGLYIWRRRSNGMIDELVGGRWIAALAVTGVQ